MSTCRCGAAWKDKRIAHCSGCHRTFSSVAQFDLHRTAEGEHGGCLDPTGIRHGKTGEPLMFLRADGIWRGPELSEAAKDRLGIASRATNGGERG